MKFRERGGGAITGAVTQGSGGVGRSLCLVHHPGPAADTMSEAGKRQTEAVFTQLQQGSDFVDSVGVFNFKLSALST